MGPRSGPPFLASPATCPMWPVLSEPCPYLWSHFQPPASVFLFPTDVPCAGTLFAADMEDKVCVPESSSQQMMVGSWCINPSSPGPPLECESSQVRPSGARGVTSPMGGAVLGTLVMCGRHSLYHPPCLPCLPSPLPHDCFLCRPHKLLAVRCCCRVCHGPLLTG